MSGADEPRRSGRATKGTSTKERDILDGEQQKGKKGKVKTAKKETKNAGPEEEEEEDEENAIIRCVCGLYDEDDAGRTMICCDNCSAWQHNECMGQPEDEDELPDKYYCEQCRPENHKGLLAAMKRGERPWEAAIKRREEELRLKKQKKGKKGKGGRQSKVYENVKESGTSFETPVASPTVSESNKRKLQDVALEDEVEQPAKVQKGTIRAVGEEQPAKRKSTSKGKKAAAAITAQDMANNIEELSQERAKVATALRGKIEPQIKIMSKQNTYRIPDGHTATSLAEQLAISIEHALHVNYAAESKDFGGQYVTQFRMIHSNIVQNVTLLLRLLKGSLSADNLAQMSSDEMASEELQRKMQEMQEEADKQSILVQEDTDGPRVRRTHKGEEFVDAPTSIVSDTMTVTAPSVRRTESISMAQSPITREGGVGSPMQVDTSRPSVSSAPRRQSSNFDIQNVWSSVQTPDREQMRTLKDQHKRASLPFQASAPTPNAQEHDAEIDRLLRDDVDDDMTLTEEEAARIGSTVWRGVVDMPAPGRAGNSIATFAASAHHVGGSDLFGRVKSPGDIFPSTLELAGRIDPTRADAYLLSLSAAHSTDVSVFRVVPDMDDPAAAGEFDKLHTYFSSRSRFGVVSEKGRPSSVRDCYLIPLDAGAAPLPTSLAALAYNLVVELPRPEPIFLAVFVTKWDPNQEPLPSIKTAMPNQPDVSTMSPYTPSTNQQQFPMQPPGQQATSAPSPAVGEAPGGYPRPPHQQYPQPSGYQAMPPPPPQQPSQTPFPPFPYPQQPGSGYQSNPAAGFPSNPYAPTPPLQFQGQPPPPPPQQYPVPTTAADELAQRILGPYLMCNTAQAIMKMGNVPEDSLKNLRKIFEENEATRDDMTAFQAHLDRIGKN